MGSRNNFQIGVICSVQFLPFTTSSDVCETEAELALVDSCFSMLALQIHCVVIHIHTAIKNRLSVGGVKVFLFVMSSARVKKQKKSYF